MALTVVYTMLESKNTLPWYIHTETKVNRVLTMV